MLWKFKVNDPGDSSNNGMIVTQGDCGTTGTPVAESSSTKLFGNASLVQETLAAAQRWNVQSYCDQYFRFLGIPGTKTRVTGNYNTGDNRVLSVIGAWAQVTQANEPGANVPTSAAMMWLSGGEGYFRAKVTVTRSVFPWQQNTREGYQQMITNGPGVRFCGWVWT